MLVLKKAERLRADIVTTRLCFISIHKVVEFVNTLFTEAFSRNESVDALLEK
jgi:hypothetical protein